MKEIQNTSFGAVLREPIIRLFSVLSTGFVWLSALFFVIGVEWSILNLGYTLHPETDPFPGECLAYCELSIVGALAFFLLHRRFSGVGTIEDSFSV